MISIADITVDSELESLLPPLSEQENIELMRSIDVDGFRDPLIVWLGRGILVDGHNRLRIKQTLYAGDDDKSPEVTEKHFADLDAVKEWMLRNQLARRNLTDAMRVQVALRLKPFIEARAKAKQVRKPADSVSPNSDEQKPIRVDEEIAKEAGVGKDTVRKVEKVLAEADDDTKAAMLAPKSDPKHISINEAHNRTTHLSNNSGNQEWYTPPEYLDSVRVALGGQIDLDPASCELANKTVKAKAFFSIDDDGLAQAWSGRLFLNPPYKQPEISGFANKLIEDYQAKRVSSAVFLCNNATDSEWGQSLLRSADAVCFKAGRIRFLDSDGKPGASPLQGQMFLYFGPRPQIFRDEFKQFGVCLK